MKQGKYPESIIEFEKSMKINDYFEKDLILSNLGMAYFLNDDINKGKINAKKAIAGAEKTNNLMALYNSYFVYSAILEQEGNKKESDIYLSKAEKVAASMGMVIKTEESNENFSPTMFLKNTYSKKPIEKKSRRR